MINNSQHGNEAQTMTEEEIQAEISRHRSRNAQLRQVLNEKRVLLAEQRPIDIHFWAWDQTVAAILARGLYRRGYLVTVIARADVGQGEERWNVEAGANIAPEKVLSDDFTEDLVRFATARDAAYDGWGTAV